MFEFLLFCGTRNTSKAADPAAMPTPGYVFRDGGAIPDSDLEEQHKEAGSNAPGEVHAAGVQQEQNAKQQQAAATNSNSSAAQTPPSSQDSKLASLREGPTDSHALAAADHDEKGLAQEGHFEAEVRDLGWTDPKLENSKRLVGGFSNEELWLLVRRFNKVR